ncbi:MAG: dicarboxylate/amino acid:cation symporter [Chlamydiales bacterium]|nr:dicarboxylate/amino acid:cation symporter [Chlamydiales bacterium]
MIKKRKSPWVVLTAIVLGMLAGVALGKNTAIFGVTFYSVFDLLGKMFINALTLIVVPLVSSSIISGIARVGNEKSFKRIGAKMFTFYLGTSLIAILIGLVMINITHPGIGNQELNHLSQTAAKSDISQSIQSDLSSNFVKVIMQIVPSNVLSAFSHGEMLGLIFFSLIFGFAVSKIDESYSSLIVGFSKGIFDSMIVFTHIIMKVLPFGVFCLVAKEFAITGFASLVPLVYFFLTVLGALVAYMFIALPLLLKVIARVKPVRLFKSMAPALITAFSTSSSSATLPITIDCVEKRAGVSNKICSLVIPLGTSINMAGSALYECVAAMFIAQVYGIEITFTVQFIVVILALVTSIGVAGVPSASLVVIIVILNSIGLPADGIGLILAVDRILDMCRTTVNVFSDSCCAILVAATEGEKEILTKDVFTE